MNEEEDFTEVGMHVTWLVNDVTAFQNHPGPTSEHDQSLPFGITHQEWYALYFDVLEVDKGEYKKWVKEHPEEAQDSLPPIEFEGEAPDYPMLSRICGYLCDAVFEVEEVEQLRQECLRVKSTTSNPLALRGIGKLMRLCDEAQRLGLNIYLMSE